MIGPTDVAYTCRSPGDGRMGLGSRVFGLRAYVRYRISALGHSFWAFLRCKAMMLPHVYTEICI